MRYSCANSHIDITPTEPCSLAGYGHRTGVWRHVTSRLEANAVLLSDGHTRVLFIAADILYFGADLVSVLERHAKTFGISGDGLVLSASHTHFAPVTERSKPELGAYDEAYNAFLKSRLIQLIDAISSAPATPVQLRIGQATTDANINRRRRWLLPTYTRKGLRLWPGIVMAPAPCKPVDSFIDTIQFLDPDGKLLCVAWKFACHPVGFPNSDNVSAEFPGHVRARLRQMHCDNVTVVFWQGFAGDVRPRLSGKRSWMDRFQTIRRGPSFAPINMEAWLAWCDRLTDAVVTALRSPEAPPPGGKLRATSVEVPLSSLVDDSPLHPIAGRATRIQKVAFGDDFSVFFFGAEVCSPYLQYLKAGPRRICVGYVGDVFGYLPSAAQAREGGYEGVEYLNTFGLAAPLRAEFQSKVLQAVQQLETSPPEQ